MALPRGGYASSSVQDGPFADNNSKGFALDTAVDDDYLIAPVPAFTGYFTGMRISFKAVTANTTGATVNVNGLGAKNLVLGVSTTLTSNFIKAGSIVDACYDGTSFQVLQPAAQ